MTSDARMIRDMETRLQQLNLDEEETAKQRKIMYKAMKLELSGFISKDLELPEGSIIVGVTKGELKQAVARGGMLWVDGEGFTALSAAAGKATGRPTQSGWEFWDVVHMPGIGFNLLSELRITTPRVNGKRK